MKTKVHSKPLNTTIEVSRLIGTVKGSDPGPSLIFTAGIHGNEPAGVFALKTVLKELKRNDTPLKGNIYAIAGNLNALEQGIRYETVDLNRVWTKQKIDTLDDDKVVAINNELQQQKEIYRAITDILHEDQGPFYFFDLHTTSGATAPFITVNDSLLNRRFTKQYPVPLILGIEEFLDGPLLSYINELGYVAFGFEGGQHDDPKSIGYCESFFYLSLVYTGLVSMDHINYLKHYHILSQRLSSENQFYEIFYRYHIMDESNYSMEKGFENFMPVNTQTVLAKDGNTTIKAPKEGLIFMPLYQGKGNDGFFLIKHTPTLFLKLSALFRKLSVDRLMVMLPGVRWKDASKEALMVDLKIARFFTRQFFHLMGYRSKTKAGDKLIVKNRESASRHSEYKTSPWY